MIRQEEAFKTLGAEPSPTAGPPFKTVWTVPTDLPYFDGHFPGFPIFPGVGILDASLFFLARRLGLKDITLSELPSAKFINPVLPGMRVRVEVSQRDDRVWQAEWYEDSSAKHLASLRFQL